MEIRINSFYHLGIVSYKYSQNYLEVNNKFSVNPDKYSDINIMLYME